MDVLIGGSIGLQPNPLLSNEILLTYLKIILWIESPLRTKNQQLNAATKPLKLIVGPLPLLCINIRKVHRLPNNNAQASPRQETCAVYLIWIDRFTKTRNLCSVFILDRQIKYMCNYHEIKKIQFRYVLKHSFFQ
jgi:hypothetical protein